MKSIYVFPFVLVALCLTQCCAYEFEVDDDDAPPMIPSDNIKVDLKLKIRNRGNDDGFECPKKYGRFAHPSDRSKYYDCKCGEARLKQCKRGKVYDEKDEECRTGCDDSKGDCQFECPFPYGRFPNPQNCSQFYTCHCSIPSVYTCPENTLYDEQQGLCLADKDVKCGRRPGGFDENRFVCPFPYGRYPDPEDCSQYFDCDCAKSTVQKCPENTLYDVRRETCLEAKNVNCGIRPGGIGGKDDEELEKEENFKCPYQWGVFAHPVDCSKYIICDEYQPSVFTCKKNELFDAHYRRCLPEDQVECGRRIHPNDLTSTTTTTTTTAPTTTTTAPPPTTTAIPITTSEATTAGRKPNTPPPHDCREDDDDCIFDKTKDVKKWFDCPGRYGHYPHRDSKKLFIHCDNWYPHLKRCNVHEEFSPVHLVCVWEASSTTQKEVTDALFTLSE